LEVHWWDALGDALKVRKKDLKCENRSINFGVSFKDEPPKQLPFAHHPPRSIDCAVWLANHPPAGLD
jgi:hypothetical protein